MRVCKHRDLLRDGRLQNHIGRHPQHLTYPLHAQYGQRHRAILTAWAQQVTLSIRLPSLRELRYAEKSQCPFRLRIFWDAF
jgi:hypothetical protein